MLNSQEDDEESDDDDDEEFNIPLSSSVKKTKTTQ